MSVLDCIVAALQSLKANILRSVLTTLGIIIGVGAVIVTVAVGAGAEARVEALIRSLGSNLIFVVPGSARAGAARLGSASRLSLTEEDADAIAQEIAEVEYATPVVRGNRQIIYGNKNWATRIQGVVPDEFTVHEWSLESGRALDDADVRRAAKVMLIGHTLVEKLFEDENPLGQVVRVNRVPFHIVGVLAEKGQTPMGTDQDDTAMIPITTAKKRVLGGRWLAGNRVNYITVKVREDDDLKQAETALSDLLRQRHRIQAGGQDDFAIRNLADLLKKRQESSRIMSLLLAAAAGISLLVGGIGIMNIMLVSVNERTREIGVRIAVGAGRQDILNQFLIEATVLSLLGGLIGIVLGVAGAIIAANVAGWPLLVRGPGVLLAFAFAGLIGIFFGYYPALKASRLNPIDALRYE